MLLAFLSVRMARERRVPPTATGTNLGSEHCVHPYHLLCLKHACWQNLGSNKTTCLPQSGALQSAGQVLGNQHSRRPRNGQSPEQRWSDEGHFYQTHPGGQSCWTEWHPEDRRQDRGGKAVRQTTEACGLEADAWPALSLSPLSGGWSGPKGC